MSTTAASSTVSGRALPRVNASCNGRTIVFMRVLLGSGPRVVFCSRAQSHMIAVVCRSACSGVNPGFNRAIPEFMNPNRNSGFSPIGTYAPMPGRGKAKLDGMTPTTRMG